MLRLMVFGGLQTFFLALLLKHYLNLSWVVTLLTLVTVVGLLSSRIWYLVAGQKSSQHR